MKITARAVRVRFHLVGGGRQLFETMGMHSRTRHAISAGATFLLVAAVYRVLAGTEIDLARVAVWSGAGITAYIALSHLFGFDPHRTRIAPYAASWVHYVDRWELRLGQATLSMLGCMIIGAKLLDEAHFVLAVVSGTLSAWTYFTWRLYAGGYRSQAERAR